MQLEIASEYQAKLMIEDKRTEDPLLLQDGWISEENGGNILACRHFIQMNCLVMT